MRPLRHLEKALLVATASALVLSACATVSTAPADRQFSLGENNAGESCTAVQNWTDPSYGSSDLKFATVYSVACEGATTGTLARVRSFETTSDRTAFTASMSCGAQTSISLDGFSSASAQRCIDSGLGYEAIVIDAQSEDQVYQIAAAPNSVGPAFQAARILSGLDEVSAARSDWQPIDISSVPALTGVALTADLSAADETLDTVLVRGASLNFRGLHASASRYLTDALNDVNSGNDRSAIARLTMEAGLADSNIKFFQNAEARFRDAAALIAELDSSDQALLRPKLDQYRGLHALNRRDFASAQPIFSRLLDQSGSEAGSSFGPDTFVSLNATVAGEGDLSGSLTGPNIQILENSFSKTQNAWALSVAELSLGNTQNARRALDVAQSNFSDLSARLDASGIDKSGTTWMDARLDRQEARLLAAQGNFARAESLFDSAISKLTRSALASSGTGAEPAIAEMKLERAALIARSGQSEANVDAAYQEAINALLDVRDDNSAFSTTALRPYLSRLSGQIEAGDMSAADRYFKAMQVTGETGAARQISELQDIAGGGATGAAKIRLAGLRTELTRLELQIEATRAAGRDTQSLEEQQRSIQSQFFELDAQINADDRFNQNSDRPATIAELQAALKPDEAYVKFNLIGERIFGLLIEKDQVHPIEVDRDVEDIALQAQRLRDSIDGTIDQGEVPVFAVPSAYILYSLLFGDVETELMNKSELVVDGGQVMNGLSPAVLVTNRDSVFRFTDQADQGDYTNIDFLAKQMQTSVANSPRSFIVSRNLVASNASKPLIGFASPEPVSLAMRDGGDVQVGSCFLTSQDVASLGNRFVPIPAREIQLAASALNLNQTVPILSESGFNDNAVLDMGQQGGELSDYKVLHFATHGVTEGQFGCPDAPAALLTSIGDAGSDMLLSFDEIALLSLDANLVVLSACETASETTGRNLRLSDGATPGGTLEGLVRSFFRANARAVLATYWESSNNGESEIFMERFYQSGRSNDIATALNDAQRSFMADRETSHPFFWGGFFVTGSTDNLMLSQGSSQQASLDNSVAP